MSQGLSLAGAMPPIRQGEKAGAGSTRRDCPSGGGLDMEGLGGDAHS